jgi:hypothetical protein
MGGISKRENAFGMHVLAKYVVDVVEDHVVVKHKRSSSGICWSRREIIPQNPRHASLI